MFNIAAKSPTLRTAKARSFLKVTPETLARLQNRDTPKGDALEVARVAAIMAVKRTSEIIPYCHPIPVEGCSVEYVFSEDRIEIQVTATTIYKTGIEIEAITGASVAALTLYDMLKMIDETMEISEIKLLKKTGGKHDGMLQPERKLRAAVVVCSDKVSRGESEDRSGSLLGELLTEAGCTFEEVCVVPDDVAMIKTTLLRLADEAAYDLILTSGGTGLGPRDVTPEATEAIIERPAPGLSEAMRQYGQNRTPYAMFSRATAGQRGSSLIMNFPGSPRGVRESFAALFPALLHAFAVIEGARHD